MVEVNGREVKFKYSVGSCIELARLCPEGDIANLMAYLNDSEAGRRAENRMRFVCILSLMGEKAAAFEAPGYKPTPLTYDEVASLTLEEFAEIFNAAIDAYGRDTHRTVRAIPSKKTEAGE